jgi:hypothetical protein
MTILAKKWFKEREGMEPDLAKELSVPSFGIGVSEVLENFGWDGKAIAAIGLEFSPDNKKVARSHFLLRGSFTKEPVSFAANKLFPEADKDIMLHVTVPDGAEFRFPNGTTASDLVPCENFKHHFSKNQQIIFPTDWAANKIGETSMRAITHLDKESNATGPKPKTTILLFPLSAEAMIQLSDATQNSAWPGIRILQHTGEFYPRPPGWADPICPLLLLGTHFAAAPNLPSLADMQFCIAAVMRSAKLPTACTSGAGLSRQWRKAINDIERLEKEPTVTWPAVARPTAPVGKC